MNRPHSLVILGAILAVAVGGAATVDREFSTPEERAKFVEAAKALEANPTAEGARGTRQALFEWLVEVPDVEVKTCADLLSRSRDKSYPYAGEITIHEVLAAGIFAIEHPDQAQDDVAMYTAAVEGALRVYEALLKSQTDARLAFFDKLLAKRDRGKLADHVAKVAKKKCK